MSVFIVMQISITFSANSSGASSNSVGEPWNTLHEHTLAASGDICTHFRIVTNKCCSHHFGQRQYRGILKLSSCISLFNVLLFFKVLASRTDFSSCGIELPALYAGTYNFDLVLKGNNMTRLDKFQRYVYFITMIR